jgi:hypothetical protein
MPGWPSRSLTGGVWSVNVFPDVNLMARRQPLLDDDIQRDVEALVASLKSETVDVSPPVGLDGRGYLGQHHELHRAGELELRRPGGRPTLARRTGRIDVQRVRGAHVAASGIAGTTQQHWKPAARAGTVVLAQKPPSTLSMWSTTSARFAKKAPAGRMSRKVPPVAANVERGGGQTLGGTASELLVRMRRWCAQRAREFLPMDLTGSPMEGNAKSDEDLRFGVEIGFTGSSPALYSFAHIGGEGVGCHPSTDNEITMTHRAVFVRKPPRIRQTIHRNLAVTGEHWPTAPETNRDETTVRGAINDCAAMRRHRGVGADA